MPVLSHRAAGWVALLGCVAGCRLERRPPTIPADLVLTNGAFYTVSPTRPWAEAVAIRDGHLVFVGDTAGADRYVGTITHVIDLGGRMAMPGFQDTHAHPLAGGLELGECNLYDARTPAEVEGVIRAYVAQHPGSGWIRGNGWQLPVFPHANPGKAMLDRLIPDRPAFFYSADGHSAWVNSRALEQAGITRATPDPSNGRIERDARGEPAGTLREAAVDLVAKLLPEYSAQERIGAARRALQEANHFGITSIVDANAGPSYLDAYRALDDRGELNARVTVALESEMNPVQSETVRLTELRRRYTGNRLTANMVKFFADGVIEARTAALLKPYLGMGANTGPMNYTPEDLAARFASVDHEGFQIHVHAIGDRAIRVALDALSYARQVNGPRDARPIIAHLEVMDPADIPRFRTLGVIASFQALWAYPDDYITSLTQPVLGPARSRWLYPIASVMNSGAVVVGGSDWTVSSLNPLDAIQVAITRRDPSLPQGPAWIPEETVDLPRMLAAYTINAAYAVRNERETGSLEVGKAADLIVLDHNLFAVPVNDLHTVKVLLTLLEGREVWRDPAFGGP